ncbi:gfo/Idh/MocA family oxidoreductase, partial [Pediococcus acidilactici]|nr:gfo/Idh/MocA family oxidoreductase [Pediococcus acidilactici]
MIKVGVIGLGNIAQKAYLPVDSQLQDRFEWYLV